MTQDKGSSAPSDPHPQTGTLSRLSATNLLEALDAGELTSVELASALMERAAVIDRAGPGLSSIIALAEDALDEAATLDAERRAGRRRGILHGLVVLVKDNIDTSGALGTTAGSLALSGSPPPVDAFCVGLLKEQGALVIAKTNLSEWANFRGKHSSSGWSAVGGQTLNPHALNRSPGGSSSGSAAAVAAGLAPLAIGTETHGSILCPAAACGTVGLKPTVGLISRTGIVPISASQDTPGPLARTVADAALLLEALAGGGENRMASGRRGAFVDPEDSATRLRPVGIDTAYRAAAGRRCESLRVGVVRGEPFRGYHGGVDALADVACEALSHAGAKLVDPVDVGPLPIPSDELVVLTHEMKVGVNAYLERRASGRGGGVTGGRRGRGASSGRAGGVARSLREVIAFNATEPAERLDLFNQDLLELCEETAGLDAPKYRAARTRNRRRSRSAGIDKVLASFGVDALLAPTMSPAWQIDHLNGDAHVGAAWSQAAIAGYPSISVPVGAIAGLPVAVTLWGAAWSEAVLLALAGAIESELGPAPPPRWQQEVRLLA
ncbi:MAG: amidase family protein [Acidimicrobiales bacterium]